jgi:transcriptional regulator GlxA family with amidase domain
VRTVAILAVPRRFPLDVSIPAHIFGRHPGYRVLLCGETDPLAAAETADTVLIPGYDEPDGPIPEEFAVTLLRALDRGARVIAVCTGVFALARGGALAGRTVTTHRRHTARLRELCPTATVLDDRSLVADGPLLTSAGASAGIDACLHVIRTDSGAAAADEAPRPSAAGAPRGDAAEASLHATRGWILENLGSPISVQQMADHSRLSRRTFIRHFTRETGLPPAHWLTQERLRTARRLLETSDWPVDRIARVTGFGTTSNFRTLFRRHLATTPTAYRKAVTGASEPLRLDREV